MSTPGPSGPSSPRATTRHRLRSTFEDRANRALNAVVQPILDSRLSWMLSRFIVRITYTGRRSGKTFTTPVLYFKRHDGIRIYVASPSTKNWWRNFLDDGGPIMLALPGGDRRGHATTTRTERGGVHVDVVFDGDRLPSGSAL